MSSGQTAQASVPVFFGYSPATDLVNVNPEPQDGAWKQREQAAEDQYARAKEAEQLKAIASKQPESVKSGLDKDFEGGFGGQEDLEDRYATTLGEH